MVITFIFILALIAAFYAIYKLIDLDMKRFKSNLKFDIEFELRKLRIDDAQTKHYYEIIDSYTKDWKLYIIDDCRFDPEEVEHEAPYADHDCIKHVWMYFWGIISEYKYY